MCTCAHRRDLDTLAERCDTSGQVSRISHTDKARAQRAARIPRFAMPDKSATKAAGPQESYEDKGFRLQQVGQDLAKKGLRLRIQKVMNARTDLLHGIAEHLRTVGISDKEHKIIEGQLGEQESPSTLKRARSSSSLQSGTFRVPNNNFTKASNMSLGHLQL